MAQVETVVQLQQAEIAAQQAEIDALKEHVGYLTQLQLGYAVCMTPILS